AGLEKLHALSQTDLILHLRTKVLDGRLKKHPCRNVDLKYILRTHLKEENEYSVMFLCHHFFHHF
ncbi:MAG: hypothetical protein AB2693_32855, partial [Candidatus Thiodiazotropha sp.]